MPVKVSPRPSDSGLSVTGIPNPALPAIINGKMMLRTAPLHLTGFMTLLGDRGDSAEGWKVGFLQAQWSETNWCSYRGQSNQDGSIFIQRGLTPARIQRACRDCVERTPFAQVFYNTSPVDGEIAYGARDAVFPLLLRVKHYDSPAEGCPLVLDNTLTRKANFLREVQLEFMFCVILTAQDPLGKFHHQMGVYWNTRWHYRFEQPGNRPSLIAAGTGAVVGAPFRVGQIDHRFASVLASTAETRSCNDLAIASEKAFVPGAANRHESRIWTDFNVTAP